MPRGTSAYDEAMLQGRLWTPLLLGSALVAWWDPTQGLSMSGAKVTAWTDRVGGLAVSQATSATQPGYSPTARNGAPGLTFSGSQYLMNPSSGGLPIGTTTSSIFASTYITNSGYASAITHGTADNGKWRSLGQENTVNNAYLSLYAYQTASGYVSLNKDRGYLGQVVSGAAPVIYVDGNASGGSIAGGTTLNTTAGNLYIGGDSSNSSGGSRLSGVIQHILVFNSILTPSQRNNLFGWESWADGKVGANLPASHPFRNRPPLLGD